MVVEFDATACVELPPPKRLPPPNVLARLNLVVPCYNEEAVLPDTLPRLVTLLDQMVDDRKVHPDSEITFIDDGSSDRTWELIEAANREDPRVKGIKLSRNRGHQNALLAGLLTAPGDVIVSLDADLQDDLEAIPKMVEAHRAGAEIVYGVRMRRDVDTRFKRGTARLYYRFLLALGVDVVPDHADFRLMSRRALDALKEFNEVNLFMRGIVPLLGFNSATVFYERKARMAGETHYPLNRMIALALDGIMSFSALPLQIIFPIGVVLSVFALGMAVWALVVRLTMESAVPGWASIVIPMYFLGGLQLLALGVIGGYLARIYAETKRRPRFIIEQHL